MRQFVADLLGDDIASGIEDYWGLNAEGEIEGAFKPTGRESSSPPLHMNSPLLLLAQSD